MTWSCTMAKNKGGREARKPKQDKKPMTADRPTVSDIDAKRPKGSTAGR
jgi:hypothetical protein